MQAAPFVLEEPEARVLEAVRDAPATADDLARATALGAEAVASSLTALELAGLVVAADGLYRVVMPAK